MNLPSGEQRRMREQTRAEKNCTSDLAPDGLPCLEGVWDALSQDDRNLWTAFSETLHTQDQEAYAKFRSQAHENLESSLQSSITMEVSARHRRLAQDGPSRRASGSRG